MIAFLIFYLCVDGLLIHRSQVRALIGEPQNQWSIPDT